MYEFTDSLKLTDPEIYASITSELERQQNQIELIASENIVSSAVLEAMGSILTNKYAEGYPGKRYYEGCKYIDEIESICIERAKKIFGCEFVNVQPHSGSQANMAVFFALLNAGDTVMGMSLNAGGHLTHGAKPSISGKWFNSIQYGVNDSGYIDYEEVEKLALENKPKLIIAGGSAYPRLIDFKKFKTIAEKVNAYFLVDMSHFAGLVAGGVIPSPIGIADIITTTTHKTLRGPRGGMILTNDKDLAIKIDKAIFPGIQGGPLEHIIAAKAVAFKEILSNDWKTYATQVIKNAKVLADTLIKHGFNLVTSGTDTHLILLDLRSKNISGVDADKVLESCGITCNKNSIPNDPLPPSITSGIRLGTPAITTRGFIENDVIQVAEFITEAIDEFVLNRNYTSKVFENIKERVKALCSKHPIY